MLGVVGLLEDASKTTTRAFKQAGATVVLLGDNLGELGGSEYLATMHGTVAGQPPALDLAREAAIQKLIISLIRGGLVESAHDCSEGGLAITLAECTFNSGGIGVSATVALAKVAAANAVPEAWQTNATLFGESASRIVVSAAGDRLDAVLAAAKAASVSAAVIGTTGGDRIRLSVGGVAVVDAAIHDAEQAWATAIERRMSGNVR